LPIISLLSGVLLSGPQFAAFDAEVTPTALPQSCYIDTVGL
jgi:hypothetical protein